MYQVIVYGPGRKKIAKKGTYQECIDWMTKPLTILTDGLTHWELQWQQPKYQAATDGIATMGSLLPRWIRDPN